MPTATRRLPGPSLEPSRLTSLARSKSQRPYVDDERGQDDEGDDGAAGVPVPA
jgi:hypothetical protein